MLRRCICAENRKLHASPIWLMFLILPIISAGYGTFNYLQNLEILTDGWYSLWTQHTLFYSLFFYPAMVAAYAAYLWRLEHMGHNWNLIMTAPVKPMCLFTAKFVVVAKLALLTHAFVFVLYVFCGRVFAHFSGWPPIELPLFLIRGALGALAVIAAQLVLAMIIRSFAVPIFLGLLGGIVGLFISSKGYALLWPYALMQMGMNANRREDALAGQYGLFVLSCILWACGNVCAGVGTDEKAGRESVSAARGTASDLQRVPLSAISADFRLCSDFIQLSAAAALKSSGATLDPDTERPLMALTFRLESGDVSLTLYAFDAERRSGRCERRNRPARPAGGRGKHRGFGAGNAENRITGEFGNKEALHRRDMQRFF